MFSVRNLRKETKDGWTRLVVDFDAGEMRNEFPEDTIWFAVEDKNANMLADDVYDAFAPFILYLGMYYHQDVHIEGKMSPRLYHNITHYLMTIFDNYSKYTKPVKFLVDGFKKIKKGPIDLVGTGISCGVDSLTTIYDNFIGTDEKGLKVNSLFQMNCVDHGKYDDENTKKVWLKRAELGEKAASELGLSFYLVDSNLHAYIYKLNGGSNSLAYIAKYCCALALQRYIKRYLTASCTSYDSCSEYSLRERDVDIAYYCETYMPHLLSTERFELVIDGCQYERSDKIEKICDWDITKKYLNVCLDPNKDMSNCSVCQKCARTLLVLEALGRLDDYKDLFDLDAFKKERDFLLDMHLRGRTEQCKSLTKFLRDRGEVKLVDMFVAHPRYYGRRALRKLKKKVSSNNRSIN